MINYPTCNKINSFSNKDFDFLFHLLWSYLVKEWLQTSPSRFYHHQHLAQASNGKETWLDPGVQEPPLQLPPQRTQSHTRCDHGSVWFCQPENSEETLNDAVECHYNPRTTEMWLCDRVSCKIMYIWVKGTGHNNNIQSTPNISNLQGK